MVPGLPAIWDWPAPKLEPSRCCWSASVSLTHLSPLQAGVSILSSLTINDHVDKGAEYYILVWRFVCAPSGFSALDFSFSDLLLEHRESVPLPYNTGVPKLFWAPHLSKGHYPLAGVPMCKSTDNAIKYVRKHQLLEFFSVKFPYFPSTCTASLSGFLQTCHQILNPK